MSITPTQILNARPVAPAEGQLDMFAEASDEATADVRMPRDPEELREMLAADWDEDGAA